MYRVILKNLKDSEQKITLTECSTIASAQDARKSWRRILGGRNWTVDRRPGLDTIDNYLALTIENK